MEFDSIEGHGFPICCKVIFPARKMHSEWFATKYAGYELVDYFCSIDHLEETEAVMLKDEIRSSFLPFAFKEMDTVMQEVNERLVHLVRLANRVTDEQRGVIEGEEWKKSTDEE